MTNAQIQEKRIGKARIFISPKELDDELLREYNEIETVEKLRFHYTFQKHRMITGVFSYAHSLDTKDVPIVTLR